MQFKRSALLALCAAALVAGCAENTNSGNYDTGVGFGSYSDYEQERLRRAAELRGETVAPSITPAPAADLSTAELLANADRAVEDGAAIVGNPNNATISDEQDFTAVSGRETIESDAQRIANNRSRYEIIQPTAVPTRSGGSGPNIVAFALSTTNSVGEQLHSRTNILSGNRFSRNCAKFASPDQAQEAFLKAGGPNRDRTGVDPDGDGFACSWDPSPFRNARRAASGN